MLNHNETTAEDDETEALTDLPVTDEQEEHVTGGSTIVGHTTISNPSGSATNIPAQIIARLSLQSVILLARAVRRRGLNSSQCDKRLKKNSVASESFAGFAAS